MDYRNSSLLSMSPDPPSRVSGDNTGLHACQLTHDISRPDFERCCTGFYNRLLTSVQEVSVRTRRYLQILEAFIWAAD